MKFDPDVPLWPEEAFSSSQRLSNLHAHLLENLADPLTAAEAARLVHLERQYFSRFFYGRVGMRFSEWVRRVRLACALEMLGTTQAAVGMISDRVGFSSPRSLQRATREVLGVTPLQYRARRLGASKHDWRRKADDS